MIYLTEAPNDRDLLPHFKGLAHLAPIPHGDFNFFGVWEDGKPITISGDRKKIGDLVNTMESGRGLRQVQDAREAGFEFLFWIIEGMTKPDRETGLLLVWKGGSWKEFYPAIEYARVDTFLDQLVWYGGVHVKRSASAQETAQQVVDVYRLFQKPPAEHSSLHHIYSLPPPQAGLLARPSLVKRVAKEFAGIGWGRSQVFHKRFKSVKDMVNASVEDFMDLDGIGQKTAESIVKEVS